MECLLKNFIWICYSIELHIIKILAVLERTITDMGHRWKFHAVNSSAVESLVSNLCYSVIQTHIPQRCKILECMVRELTRIRSYIDGSQRHWNYPWITSLI